MKLLIKIFTAALLVSLSTQAHSLEKLKLMDVVSEPEGNLKREIYLELDKNRHIRSLEILVDGKLDMKASAEDFEKGEVLITNVRGFDSVFLNCIRCDTDKARLELRYLQNRATGKFITKTIEIKRMGAEKGFRDRTKEQLKNQSL